ncbi:MAG: PEP-CTERM sorting domain-containing protein [Thermoguttaceae bacterium]|nr:PEP-CTERM sorting domain-containing protein [Thermoguttaceae bacterium]
MRSTRVNRVILSHRFLTCVLVAAFLAAAVLGDSAQAQTDLKGASKEITASGPWNVDYTNTNADQTSNIVIGPLTNSTRFTYSGALTGNIHVDVTHQSHTNNENRFTISNAGNTFTGGLTMHGGILHVTNANQLASFSGGLTLDNAVFMAFDECNFDVTIPEGAFGGMRASGGNIVLNQKVTGAGDLVVVTEAGSMVELKGTNDYAGVTSIGTVRGGSNIHSYLILGADNTLPSTTVVEVGKSQIATYAYSPATASLDLKGTTQTIAGLHGSSIATITNSSEDAGANVTINLAAGKSYDYAGSITGKSAALLTNLTITGEGNQTFGGNISNASITSSTTGTLTIGGNTVTLASLEVSAGTLALAPNVNMTVSGNLTYGSTLDLNGSSLTYKSNVATDFNNVAITNTNTDKLSVLTIAPTANLTAQQSYNKKISGNTRLVVKLPQNQNNLSRFILGGTNDFTGGLYIEQGTVRVDNYASLGTNKQIDMKHSSLMTNQTFAGYTINLVGDASAGERGAIRLSGGDGNFKAKITGVGSLEIVYDGPVTLTNTENDYQGKTYLGNFQWRKDNNSGTGGATTLNLGNDEVLPDKTIVVFGKDANGSGTTSGVETLDLNGHKETVAGITNEDGRGVITSTSAATLTVNANADYTYKGKVTGSATLEKKGTGTLTITGNNTGSLAVTGGTLILTGDNSGAQSITVGEGGTFIPAGTNSAATQINLQGGTLNCYSTPHLDGSTITATAGDSTINIIGPEAGTYARQLFTGTAKDMSDLTNPEFISNMDKIANTAYPSGSYDADVWGNKGGDENNTNLLQTRVVNTTGSPISLDFAYQFRNSAYLAVTDSAGNMTVVMDWVDSSNHPVTDPVSGVNYEYANNAGSFTFEPGEAYTIEARLFRFNRTIGANGGGLNGFDGTLVGLGAKVSGSEGEYLPLNFDGNNWTFGDGSFTFSKAGLSFADPVTVSEDASIVINSPNSDLDITSPISGAGTITFNQDEGFVHTYSGTANAPQLSVVKTGLGTMQINAAQGVFNVKDLTVAAGRLDMKEYLTGRMQVNNGASFSPGNSIGKLTVDGSFALGQALEGGDLAKIIMEIAGPDADQNDQLIVTGDLELNNGVVLLEFSEGIHLNQGDTVTVLFSADNSADLEPTFIKDYVQAPALLQNLSYVQLGSGYWAITAAADYNAVPEPATWALLLLGVFGLLYTRKRR